MILAWLHGQGKQVSQGEKIAVIFSQRIALCLIKFTVSIDTWIQILGSKLGMNASDEDF